MLRFLDVANAVSLAGLGAALGCALLAASGRPAYAIAALIVAGLCDLFDGAIARRLARTAEQRQFGARLDSLVDACAFGLAPAVLCASLGLRHPAELVLVFALLFACVWRLAYFDTVGLTATEGRPSYIGLPTTYVALVLPVTLLAGFIGPTALRTATCVAAAALAVAMVSPLRIPKPGGAWYGVFLLLAVVLIGIYTLLADRFAA
jgi:CDP-diacylglycerol--serine O-phosphatidyltransferase